MGRRDGCSPEARERERSANRQRMARLRQDPAYRARINARRKERDRERKVADPDIRPRLTASHLRYHHAHKDDPEYREKRLAYLRRWRAERRVDEEFEAFMTRMLGMPT
jgi:hypothetical protein